MRDGSAHENVKLFLSEPLGGSMGKGLDLLYIFVKPALFLILAIGFLFLIVKPFLRMLAESGALTKKIDMPEKSKDDLVKEVAEGKDEDFTVQRIMNNRDKIVKLVESSPDKAGDVVKKWIRKQDEE